MKSLRSQRRANRFHQGKSMFRRIICYHYKTPVIVLKGSNFNIEVMKDRIKGYVISRTPIPDISFENIRDRLPNLHFK